MAGLDLWNMSLNYLSRSYLQNLCSEYTFGIDLQNTILECLDILSEVEAVRCFLANLALLHASRREEDPQTSKRPRMGKHNAQNGICNAQT